MELYVYESMPSYERCLHRPSIYNLVWIKEKTYFNVPVNKYSWRILQ